MADEDLIAWAVRSGRFSEARAPYWRRRLADEKRVMASGGEKPALPVEELIRSMAPVLADDTQAGRVEGSPWARDEDGRWVLASAYGPTRRSATPLLDEVTEALYGPDVQERRNREDAQAEAEMRRILEEEQERIAASALTADEQARLFPPSHEKT